MPVASVHVIYRIAPTRKSEVRPEWFTQKACLLSFICAVDVARAGGLRLRSTVIVDGQIDSYLDPILEWFDVRDQIELLGNSKAFRHALDVALLSDEEIILFAEDDYMWLANSVLETVRALTQTAKAAYVTPYAHPDSDRPGVVEAGRNFVVTSGGVEWRSALHTTMTFACRTSDLAEGRHFWHLATYGKSPKDGYAFRALLSGHWFQLVGNAAFRDARRVLNIATLRVVATSTWRRIQPSRRPLLLQPVDGLATHVHQPFITGSTDWPRLAMAFDQPHP